MCVYICACKVAYMCVYSGGGACGDVICERNSPEAIRSPPCRARIAFASRIARPWAPRPADGRVRVQAVWKRWGWRLPRPVQIVQLSKNVNCAIVRFCKLCNLQILQVAQFTCEPLARLGVRLEGGEGRGRRPRAKAGPARV